jgi:hypothetical protein
MPELEEKLNHPQKHKDLKKVNLFEKQNTFAKSTVGLLWLHHT